MNATNCFQIIDLTHEINEKVCVWDGSCGYRAELTGDYDRGGFRGHSYTMRSCLGTHLDSPSHCFRDAPNCSTMTLENGIAPAYVIDISEKSHEDYLIGVEDIFEFENKHGAIKAGSVVFFFTGWSNRWNDPDAFINAKSDGIPHFPSVSKEVAQLLLKRKIAGIGVDTFSPDVFYREPLVHRLLLGAGKYIIENVAHLEKMPSFGAQVIVLPLKIAGGAESPIRLVGLINNNELLK